MQVQILPRSLFNNERNNTMTKENAAQYLPLVKALAEGKVIEYYDGSKWVEVQDISFYETPDFYRIKPEPREWWLVKTLGGAVYTLENESQAKDAAEGFKSATIHHVREVIQ